MGNLLCYRGKAAEGRRIPGRWREFSCPTNCAKRFGLRQPSGALGISKVVVAAFVKKRKTAL
jgi:hypothetical protein